MVERIPSETLSMTEIEYNKQNFQVGNVVFLKEDFRKNIWPMVQIVSTEPDSCCIVQSVQLKVTNQQT